MCRGPGRLDHGMAPPQGVGSLFPPRSSLLLLPPGGKGKGGGGRPQGEAGGPTHHNSHVELNQAGVFLLSPHTTLTASLKYAEAICNLTASLP